MYIILIIFVLFIVVGMLFIFYAIISNKYDSMDIAMWVYYEFLACIVILVFASVSH